jgi:hypothetical protein
LQPKDVDYAEWIRDIIGDNPKHFLNYRSEQGLGDESNNQGSNNYGDWKNISLGFTAKLKNK